MTLASPEEQACCSPAGEISRRPGEQNHKHALFLQRRRKVTFLHVSLRQWLRATHNATF